jgi:transcriptional regulator with XRE-family HTH domain
MTERFDLRVARVNEGLSQRKLAEVCGVSRGTVRLLEERKPVRPSTAKQVADHFGIEVTDLMPLVAEASR